MKRLVLLLTCALAIPVGCVQAPARIEGSLRGVELAALQHWNASGRIGVAAAESGGSGSFDWRQQGTQSAVQLRGPVGMGNLQLHLQGDEVEVTAANGESYRAEAAMQALESSLGAVIPPAKLRFWMTGQAAPGAHHWLDAAQSVLEQDGWRIEYVEYLVQEGLRLPARIVASSGATRVRIRIERWRIG